MENNNLSQHMMNSLIDMYNLKIISYLTQFVQGELAVMFCIAHSNEKEITPSLLSDKLNLTKGRMTAILTSLEKRGFVGMKRSLEDKRKVFVWLTEDGKTQLDKKEEVARNYFILLFKRVGKDNIAKFVECLDVINEAMKDVK